jgi:protein-tyrosine phosphatase
MRSRSPGTMVRWPSYTTGTCEKLSDHRQGRRRCKGSGIRACSSRATRRPRHAKSRALAIERGINNIGPLSPLVLWGLTTRGLSAKRANRPPEQCVILDLKSADYVIALNELEHRPLMNKRFPNWESRIQYWEIGDVELMQPSKALALIDAQVDALVACLSRLSDGRIAS